ncbi:hypothetical protein EI998_09160 [Streptococcus suis]|uniref:Pierisin-like domain-containing protein n=1 Tax=Streptococcus suis TaxID=1307 RepID=A0A426TAY2_STRSU|nr:enterotoxin A family protein [Streptococcus suis]NQP64972.1 hypothetical protein [Streptococcus suis]RRR51198.1 hypothetical protein EI998_09160 [Streptococcus suis]HEL2576002.1 hypothetical protein [Streptococcus suis]
METWQKWLVGVLASITILIGLGVIYQMNKEQEQGIATAFVGKNGYLYEISSNRGIDVNKTLDFEAPYPEQMEFSIPSGIPSSEIKGAWSINKGVVSDYLSNPNFGGGR